MFGFPHEARRRAPGLPHRRRQIEWRSDLLTILTLAFGAWIVTIRLLIALVGEAFSRRRTHD